MLIRSRCCRYRMLLLLILYSCNGAFHQNLIALLGSELKRANRAHKVCRLVTARGRVDRLCLTIDDGRAG